MKVLIGAVLLSVLTLILIGPAVSDAAPDAAMEEVKKFDGGTPPGVGKEQPPKTIAEGVKDTGTLIEKIKAKAWWAVAGIGVFLVMLILQVTKVMDKLSKRWRWIVTGLLSLIAALLFAFDSKGFSWDTFTAFASAGPTVAWLRGFVKKAVMNLDAKKES